MSEAHPMPEPIAKAIGAIMTKVKNVEKQGTNTFHNYKFAKVEDLLFQVQPAMAEAGLVITQDEIHHEVLSDAIMLATYAFSLSHDSGVTWGPIRQTGMSNLRNTKGGYDDKALNKCHTAARKYFILGLFQVPAGELPDADTEEDRPAPAKGRAVGRQDPNSLAQKKRDGVMEAMFAEIDACIDMVELRQWWKDHSAEILALPQIWQDAISDRKEARKAELDAADLHAEQDAEFRGVVGDPAPSVANRGTARQAA